MNNIFVLTSHDKLGVLKETDFGIEEFANPSYTLFGIKGRILPLATPKGGAATK